MSNITFIIYLILFNDIILLKQWVVVWNPWEKKAKTITDMGDEEYRQTICVDGAAVEKSITLKPGEEWTGRLELSVLPSI